MDKTDIIIARQYLNTVSPKPNTTAIIQNNFTVSGLHDLTVIIPCYNEEKYIKQCIDSVLKQINKYKIKIVIVNDGSTDYTINILKEYETFQDIIIINQENRGFSGARNRGLQEIDSNYVFFLDADDYLIENTLEKMLDIALEYQADIIESQMLSLVGEQLILQKTPTGNVTEIIPSKLSGYVCGKMINTELFHNICFPEHYWYEDSIMAYLIYPRCQKTIQYNQNVYVYRKNTEGITCKSLNQKKSIDTYWITELMLENMNSLAIEITQDIYELILRQIALNYVRTQNQESYVKIAIFVLTSEWFRKLHSQYSTTFRFSSILEKALDIPDYNLYETGCTILWNKLLQL